MGLLGVARSNSAVGVSPEPFLLQLLLLLHNSVGVVQVFSCRYSQQVHKIREQYLYGLNYLCLSVCCKGGTCKPLTLTLKE
jgi:hypothetical protein